MSHFTVMVRLPANTIESDIESAVSDALIPFKESGCGDNDPEELKKYLTFEDSEDEHREEYETGSTERVKMPDGSYRLPWDEQFRVKGTFGTGSDTHKVPDHLEKVEVPYKETFSTFEDYMREWCGIDDRDEETGRYGHWKNGNAKWDWYAIGGRWSGHLPVFGSKTKDYARIKQLDLAKVDDDTKRAADAFWHKWESLIAGDEKEDHPFEGCRMQAIKLGLMSCKDENELTGSEWKTKKWERQLVAGRDRFDVYKNVPQEIRDEYIPAFDTLATYSHLCAERGWVAPGEMGWFGVSSDDPDGYLMFKREFRDWLKSGDQRDWIVVVDCHI